MDNYDSFICLYGVYIYAAVREPHVVECLQPLALIECLNWW